MNGHLALHSQSMEPKVSRHRAKSKRVCGICGRDPAAGHASVYRDGKETWFCHEDGNVTCYERASSAIVENTWATIVKETQ